MRYLPPYYNEPPAPQRHYQPPPPVTTYSYPSGGSSTIPTPHAPQTLPPPRPYKPYSSPSYPTYSTPVPQPTTPRPRAAAPPHIAPSPTYPSLYPLPTEPVDSNPYSALGLSAYSPVTQFPTTPQQAGPSRFHPSPGHPVPSTTHYTPRYLATMEQTAPVSPAAPSTSTPVLNHAVVPPAPPSGGSATRIEHHLDPYDQPPHGSVGPSAVTLLELGAMSGHPSGELSAKCEITFPPDTPSPTYPSPRRAGEGKSPRVVRIAFGQEGINTSVSAMSQMPHGSHIITLRGQVPAWPKVARTANGPMVPVRIEVMLDGELESYLEIGEFKYESFSTGARVATYGTYAASNLLSTNPLKRSGTPLESQRVAPGPHRRVLSSGGRYEHSPDMPHAQLPALYTNQPMMSHGDYEQPPSPWIEEDTKPMVPGMYPSPSQPNLQRATQIPGAAPVTAAYSPVTKATLELMTDLSNMARGWSPEEWGDRRRLVQFWRRQTGTQITAYCHPITPIGWVEEQKKGGCIVVSCIYREETNMCYVTSVDAIYLLEALVGSRFTVEEKNRIRRNLEGFRPQTVSKSKPGSEEFFKLIMGFPNPKPRNIEKDVKVFPWDVLGQALKKIIGKYSASGVGGSPSPALSASSQLPTFGTPYAAPTPLQPMEPMAFTHPFEQDASFDSAPPGLSTGISTDSIYPSGSMYSLGGPQTPHLGQHPHDPNMYAQVYADEQYNAYPSAYPTGHGHENPHGDSPTQHRSKSEYHPDLMGGGSKLEHGLTHTHADMYAQGEYGKMSPHDTSPTESGPAGGGAYPATYYSNLPEPVSPSHGAGYGMAPGMAAYPMHQQPQGGLSQHHSTSTVHGEAHTLIPSQGSDHAQLAPGSDAHSRQSSGELRVMYPTAAH